VPHLDCAAGVFGDWNRSQPREVRVAEHLARHPRVV
jgi:hypothetical protein